MDNKEKINDILENALNGIVDVLGDMSAGDKESFLGEKFGKEDDRQPLTVFGVEILIGFNPTEYSCSASLKIDKSYRTLFKALDKETQEEITEDIVDMFKEVSPRLPIKVEKAFKKLQED